jgi:CubicO group peptidase (beta-lactamase class C family)
MGELAGVLPKTEAVIESGRAAGLHTGAQLYISRGGRGIVDLGIGEARSGTPMTEDSILLWLSAGKPLTAVALARFWEAGKLDLDDRVVRFIPEFGARGKDSITIRHLLTHTAGIRWIEWSADWDEIIARICRMPIEPRWVPGRTAGYHAFTSWYILGEILRRIDSARRPYEKLVAEELFLPLGMKDCFLAMTVDQFRENSSRIAPIEATNGAKTAKALFDTDSGSGICSPGGSARGPARELGRFYEMMLERGRTLISPETVEALTARHRVGIEDLTFKQIMDWGLGFIINSRQYGDGVPYGYGPYASPRTFGHGGNQSSVGFADPENGLVVVLIFNGMPGEAAHQQRMREALSAIYEDLGIGG